MSDRIIPMHTLACDWPGCEETAAIRDGNSYRPTPPGWHRGALGCDLCPRHWREKQQQLMGAQEIVLGKREAS